MLFFLFVQWKIKTKQFLAELRLLHPGVRLSRTAGLFYDGHPILYYVVLIDRNGNIDFIPAPERA